MANYSSMRLELLALKWVIKEQFRSYLLGSQFEVYTDNNPLSHLENAMLGAIEQRWVSQLASFDFKIHYRRSKSNANADALSGMMEDSSTDNFLEIDEDYIKSVCEIATRTTALLSEMKSTVKEVKVPAASSEVSTRYGKSHDSVDREQDVTVTETLPVYSKEDLNTMQHSDPTIEWFLHHCGKQQQPSQSDRRSESKATVTLLRQWDRIH